MKPVERKRLERVFGNLYTRFVPKGESGDFCYYCGDYADTLDHVPPLNSVENMRMEEWHKQKLPFVLIRACTSCNSKLGSKPIYSILERVANIIHKLEKEYEKVMDNKWSDTELKELGKNLKSIVSAYDVKTAKLQSRLNFAHWRFAHEETWPEYSDILQ